MNFLIICYYYPPTVNARSIRWSAIAEYLANNGHGVDVISSWRPDTNKKEILNGVHVYRVSNSLFEKLRHSIIDSDSSIVIASSKWQGTTKTAKANDSPLFFTKKIVRGIYHSFIKKLFWPDFAWFWFFPALKKAGSLIKRKSYDALITVSLPFTGHLVGLVLNKKRFNMQWLVDSGDPFCFMDQTPVNNHRLYAWLNRKIEHKIFIKADCLSVTTDLTAKKYNMFFPEIKSKMTVIPPLLNMDGEIADTDGTLFDKSKTIISYIGTLYKNIREPDDFLQLIDAVVEQNSDLSESIELHFYGACVNCIENFSRFKNIQKIIHLHGTVPRSTAINVMLQSDVLVNIGNRTSYQLPSKLVEYVSTGKPIINLCSISEDSSKIYLNNYPLVFNRVIGLNSILQDVRDLARFLSSVKGRKLSSDVIQELINPHSIETIAQKYIQLLTLPEHL